MAEKVNKNIGIWEGSYRKTIFSAFISTFFIFNHVFLLPTITGHTPSHTRRFFSGEQDKSAKFNSLIGGGIMRPWSRCYKDKAKDLQHNGLRS